MCKILLPFRNSNVHEQTALSQGLLLTPFVPLNEGNKRRQPAAREHYRRAILTTVQKIFGKSYNGLFLWKKKKILKRDRKSFFRDCVIKFSKVMKSSGKVAKWTTMRLTEAWSSKLSETSVRHQSSDVVEIKACQDIILFRQHHVQQIIAIINLAVIRRWLITLKICLFFHFT